MTLVDCGSGVIDLVAVQLDANGDRVAALYAPNVAIEDALLPGGYEAVRAHGFGPLTRAISGPSGTIVIELPSAPAG